eukprot:7089742-Pyramimonas_sp.AAC.1
MTPKGVEGRLGAVRCRGRRLDMTFVVGYAPTEPHGAAGTRRAQEVKCRQFWKALGGLIDLLPARTVPILLMDANAKMGGTMET